MKSMTSLVRTLCLGALTALAGCGGGDLPTEDLEISFSYSGEEGYAFSDMTVSPSIEGREGHDADCKLEDGRLPNGLTLLRGSCRIEGSPTETGDFPVTIRLTVENFQGHIDEDVFIMVRAPELWYEESFDPLVQGEPMTPQAANWTGYTLRDGDVVTYSADGEDGWAGLVIDAATGEISGRPEGIGALSAQVKARIERGEASLEVTALFFYSVREPE